MSSSCTTSPEPRVRSLAGLRISSTTGADGTLAVGLFNRGFSAAEVQVNWSALKLRGKQPVRDLWLHKDLGESDTGLTAAVPPHGTVLVKIGANRK